MITITMGGVSYSPNEDVVRVTRSLGRGGFDWRSLSILDVLAPTGDTMTVRGTFRLPEDIPGRLPQTEQEVRVVHRDDAGISTTLFGGILEKIDMEIVGFNQISFSISARDYAKWLSRKLISGVFTQATGGAMVQSIFDTFTTEFTTNGITDITPVLPKVYNFVPGIEAVQEIADTVDAIWYITPDRDVVFRPSEAAGNAAPLSHYDVDKELGVGNLKISIDTTDIQNSLIIKDFTFRGPNVYYLPSNDTHDGFASSTTGYELSAADASAKRVLLDSVPYDLNDFAFAVNTTTPSTAWVNKTPVWDTLTETAGVPKVLDTDKVYIKSGKSASGANTTVRWGFSTSAGDHIRISYRPLLGAPFPDLTREVYSIDEFGRREASSGRLSDGIHEKTINFNDLEFGGDDPLQVLADFASQILKYRAWPRVEGSFETTSLEFSGKFWKAGQKFYMRSRLLNLFDLGAWTKRGRPANRDFYSTHPPLLMWVTSVKMTMINPDVIHYVVYFSNNPRPL